MLVSEIKLREMIRSRLLSEIEDDMSGSYGLVGSLQARKEQKQDFRDSLPKLGKRKYSYEKHGEPQAVIVATVGKNEICAVYSAATISDPVASGYGKLIPKELMNEEWNIAETFKYDEDTFFYETPQELYKKYKLFIVNDPKPPRFQATSAAYNRSKEGKGTYGKGDMLELLGDLFLARYGAADADEVDRLMGFLQDNTVDSFTYGLMQSILGLIPGFGLAIDAAMDAVPGAILVAYHLKRGNKDKALSVLMQTLAFMAIPAIAQGGLKKLSKVPVKDFGKGLKASQFILTIVPIVVIILIADEISKRLLGDSVRISEADVTNALAKLNMSKEDFMASSKQEIGNLDIRQVIDPHGLAARYPAR